MVLDKKQWKYKMAIYYQSDIDYWGILMTLSWVVDRAIFPEPEELCCVYYSNSLGKLSH